MYELKISYQTFSVGGPNSDGDYIGPDSYISDKIKSLNNHAKINNGKHEDNSTIGEYTNTIGLQEKFKKHYPQEVQEFINNYGYIFAGSAAFAVFLNNSSAAIKNIIEILKKYGGTSSITVTYKGNKITIKNGDDIDILIKTIQESESKSIP